MEDFEMPQVRGSPPCRDVLRDIRGRCKLMPELETLLLRVVDRLETLLGKVAQVDANDPLRAAYVDTIVRLVKITHKKPLLVRLAKCDTIAHMIHQLQLDIADIARDFELGDEAEMAKWSDEWRNDRYKQFSTLKRLTLGSSDRQLRREVQGGRLLEVVADLKHELTKALPEEQLQLKQMVFTKVTTLSQMKDICLFDWFISVNDLVFDDGPIVAGTFGEVRRATWFHDNRSDKVVVKQLLAPLGTAARDPFTRQLNVWRELPAHPNILKFHGGCNVGPRQFYVCEDAVKGSLADYCRVPRSSVMIWRMLVQVAEGLDFLHERGISHGGLTCNNILVGENNVPKLSDFGFSSLRHLSMGMSVSCYQSQSHYYYLDDCNTKDQRLESDIYALGKCITEALEQTQPFGIGGTDGSSSGIHRIVSKLCAPNYCDRLTIKEAAAEMRRVFKDESTFPIDRLKGSPPSLDTLRNMTSRFQRMPESEKLCRHLLELLQYIHDPVVPLAIEDPLKQKYIDVVIRFLELLRPKPLLQRLASCETMVTIIHELRLKLNDIGQTLGLIDESFMIQYNNEWDVDLAEYYGEMIELVTSASDRILVNGFRGKRKVEEALQALHSSINESGQPPEVLDLKKSTFDRVGSYLNLESLPMYSWFIPSVAVECEKDVIGFGSTGEFGEARRGTWLHDGERKQVAVKLWFQNDLDSLFSRLLELWCTLPHSEHVLKIYGGSHLSSPPFYVCEEGPFDDLIDFLVEHNDMIWRLFAQAAEGLKFLHDNNIVHGNLKCGNILIGESHTVKLVNCLPLYKARQSYHRHAWVRWKPKEQLEEVADMGASRYESDIYSLGMCMIEAITRMVPFGLWDDESILRAIFGGARHPRPDGVADDVWALIAGMCDPDYTQRPTISVVIDQIRTFTREEESTIVHPWRGVPCAAKRTTPQNLRAKFCSCCGECAADEKDPCCRWCGYYMQTGTIPIKFERYFNDFRKIRKDIVSRHGLTTLLKSSREIDAWSKLYEVAIAVRDLHVDGHVHADLKPANMFVGRDGKSHLSFEYSNLAAKFARYDLAVPLNEAFRWQSPEVLLGGTAISASDVYALGMCVIYVVSGDPPWGTAVSDVEAKSEVCNERAMAPRVKDAFTNDQWDLIVSMCAHDPENRISLSDVIIRLADMAILVVKRTEAPEWQMTPGDITFRDDVSFSRTQYVSRHVGRWKDAAVTVGTFKKRFKGEGRSFREMVDLWFSLKHPGILQLFGAYDDLERQFFVCEPAKWGDLGTYISKSNFATASAGIWQVLLDVALAIRYLHAIGVVHGDVGLHNILVDGSGHGKLTGFILSSQFHELCPESPESEPNAEEETETKRYTNASRAGFASDVYWLGSCIVDIFCGSGSLNSGELQTFLLGKTQSCRPKVFSEEEWRLVSDVCCNNPCDRIFMPEVVERLSRLAAVNMAIETELLQRKQILPQHKRQTLQAMVLEEVLVLEQEEDEDDEEAERCRIDDSLYDDEFCDPWTGIPRKTVMVKCMASSLAEYATTTIFKDDVYAKLMVYQARQPTIVSGNVSRTDYIIRPRPSSPWSLPHATVVESKGVGDIGGGSFATVCHGMWLGVPVALKKLKKVDLDHDQALRQETNLWFNLRHPHIVSLFGVCCGGYQLLVCDLVDGSRLDKYCSPESSNSNEKVWGLLHDSAIGLQGLHLHGVVHADLKCDNILVTKDGRAKLIDFGLSCLSTCDGGKTLGAPRWKSPECLLGGGPTFASDVFSFGMCIIQALTGAFPWGESIADVSVAFKVTNGRIPSQPSIFSKLQWELVERMCCFQPEDRLQLDDVVKVLGFFANRDPYVSDQSVQEMLASWERDPLETPQRQ